MHLVPGPALTRVHGARPQTVPFFAVAAAGSCNAALMRYKDLTCVALPPSLGLSRVSLRAVCPGHREGIEVFSPDGESFGRSIEAGKRALGQVIATRIALPVPVLLLPPVMIEGLSYLRLLPSGRGRAFAEIGAGHTELPPRSRGPHLSPRARTESAPLDAAVVIACIGGAFPCAIGIFPQVWSRPAPSSYVAPGRGHCTR